MTDRDEGWSELRRRRMGESGARQSYAAAQAAFLLGARVRRLREARGWSQTELARRSNLTQSALARFEAGGTVPTLPVLYRLADALGVRLDVSFAEPSDIAS